MRYLGLAALLCVMPLLAFGQHAYGTTGLLYAPTAEMQKDKTFMAGGSMVDHNTYRSSAWKNSSEYKPYTFNYYLNVTIFPWLEVAYTCTLFKGVHGSGYWPPQTWGKFVNQDRSFHFRLRAWKETMWARTPTTLPDSTWLPPSISPSSNGGYWACMPPSSSSTGWTLITTMA